jgi:glyoxylase-like metal-dependent hydrolase (beta-lactamase superfamily II)/rhodanese-related sulfurtransferase
MYVEQLYTNCLAHAAYYIESEGEAAIIDPLRETDQYIGLANSRGARIRYILETHFHADFVSGHLDLAQKTGAQLVFGPNATTHYPVRVAADGDRLTLGKVSIEVLHTPGHTLESSCYLLRDEAGKPVALFTGDTLFIGDVGRPDLAIKSDLTVNDLAGMLYDSLHAKILPLPNDVVIYPGHGAGSACGKNLSSERFQTLGNQKETNYALQPQTREAFVAAVTDGLAPPPGYFAHNALMNKGGYEPLEQVLARTAQPLTAAEVASLAHDPKVLVLDTRAPEAFAQGHIAGSLNIGLNGQYAPWVGALIPFGQRLVLVADAGKEQEALVRLARVGYENVAGYLAGGIAAWKSANYDLRSLTNIAAPDVPQALGHWHVLDVRNPAEYAQGHIPGAIALPLGELERRWHELDPQAPYLVHCAGGYRSVIAASLLARKGFAALANVPGGWGALKSAGLPTEATAAACGA